MDALRRPLLLRVLIPDGPGGSHLYAVPTWLFVGLLVLLFSLQGREQMAHVEQQQIREALRASRFTAQTVARTLAEQRRLVALFARQQAPAVDRLIREPLSAAALFTLHESMQQYFPDAFAVTVADAKGVPLVDDFDGLVGEICQNNIRHFARLGHDQPIFMHPHPEVYHYDIMVTHGKHILFISFRPDQIIRALGENAALGQKMLLYKAGDGLIELAAEGTRLQLQRAFHLSREEHRKLLVRLPVAGTEWTLGILPDAAEVERQRRDIRYTVGFSIAGAMALAILLHVLIHLEMKRRLRAEDQAREMGRLSLVDPLTGLPNRRALDDALTNEWLAMQRGGSSLIVMMADVDHFKAYNDSQGHPAGDAALKAVAGALNGATHRPRDLVARFGGEEFVVLLPDTECDAAPGLAEQLRVAVQQLALPHPASPDQPQVSISIGLVCARAGQVELPMELIRLADEALYRAKQEGRNCIRRHDWKEGA